MLVPEILKLPPKIYPVISKFNDYRYFLLEGGRGGGKSQAIGRLILYLAEHHKLRIVCGRETQNSINESVYSLTVDLIQKYNLNFDVQASKIIHRESGSTINFRGFREQGAFNIQGMEGIDITWIDEAQAITKQTLDVLIPTIRKDNAKIIFTMNRHVHDDPAYATFYDRKDCLHIHIDYFDNPFCTEALKNEANQCKLKSIQDYNHIWLGEPLAQADDKLFDYMELMASKELFYDLRPNYGRRLAGFDPARMGDDKTGVVVIEQRGALIWEVVHVDQWEKKLAPETVGRMLSVVNDLRVQKSGVDEDGLGGPILDFAQLRDTFVGVRNPTFGYDKDKYYGNNRTKNACLTREMINKRRLIIKDDDLIKELNEIRYTFDHNQRRILIKKEEMKRKFNVPSPNLADALFIAVSLIADASRADEVESRGRFYTMPQFSKEENLFQLVGVA